MKTVSLSRFAGVRNTLPVERLHALPSRDNPTVDLAAAVNVDIDNSGQVSRRAGQALVRAGAAHSLWAQGDDCLFASGTTLYRLQPDLDVVALATVAADAPLRYVAINDRVYWTNGVETGVIVAGVNRSWGMTAADMPQLSAIGGTLPAGLYQGAITYVRSDGQESGAGMTSTITLTDDAGVRFFWDAPTDTDIEDVNLYLSEPNGMVLYQVGTAPVGQESADVTEAGGALPLNTQWNDKPPPGSHLAYHNGRLFIADGPFVFGTTALGYEYCDLRDYISVDGTPIRFLAGVPGGLYIGTALAVYFASGSRLEEFALRTLVTAPAVAGSTVLADGLAVSGRAELAGRTVVLFTSAAGVHMGLEDGALVTLTDERYALPALSAGAAVFRHADALQQYLLFPAGIVLNTHTMAVSTYTGLNANSACAFGSRVLAATEAGLVELTGDTDLGAPIAASVTSGVSDLDDSHAKRILFAVVGYQADGDLELTLTGDTHHEYLYRLQPRRLGESHATRLKFGRGVDARYWQWALTNRDGAAFALDTLDLMVQPLGRLLP